MLFRSVISISGRISSGKSYVSDLIANQTGFPVASFGGYLKHYCQINELPIGRKTLQDVGEAFIKEDSKQFLINVINQFKQKGDCIILDGVRHIVIFQEIQNLTTNTLSIFVDADQSVRYNRYSKRSKDSDQLKSYEHFIEADNHPVELETETLKPLCDIVLNSQVDYSLILQRAIHTYLQP